MEILGKAMKGTTLERAGIVASDQGTSRPTLYVAREVLAILEDDEA